MSNLKNLKIIRPDDWHIHLREGELLQCVINSTARVIGRCIVMPNLSTPITTSSLCKLYKDEITKRMSEMKEVFEKSVVSIVKIPKGAIITREMIGFKKPGSKIMYLRALELRISKT